jgi:hypothetical protein
MLMQWVDGAPALESPVDTDVEALIDFFNRLQLLKQSTAVERIGPAAEACFSVQALKTNLENRMSALATHLLASHYVDGANFWLNEVCPMFKSLFSELSGEKLIEELKAEERLLSPSDFGWHNALRKDDGQLTWIDFEYFGWDDPAKAICDFRFHPACNATPKQVLQFTHGICTLMSESLEAQSALQKRVELLKPMYGLKWVMILLNVFLPDWRNERGLNTQSEVSLKCKEQFNKAERMLSQIKQLWV